jgi:Mitochondrial carrier protein
VLQIAVASGIIKQDGVGALYRGLSAGLLRQATYTTARLGIYQAFSDALVKHNDGGVCATNLLIPPDSFNPTHS